MGSKFYFFYFYHTSKISKVVYFLLNTENLTYNNFYLTKYIFILARKNNFFCYAVKII
jgi:hypothetical protein